MSQRKIFFEELKGFRRFHFSSVKNDYKKPENKATTEVASGEIEISSNEVHQLENCVASTSKSPKIQTEYLYEIKTCLRRKIMADLTKILAENQKQMLEVITTVRKTSVVQNLDNSDPENENVLPNTTSTSMKA